VVMETLESDRLDGWQSSILMDSRTLEQHLDGLAALGASRECISAVEDNLVSSNEYFENLRHED
jgi:hypothetical protein